MRSAQPVLHVRRRRRSVVQRARLQLRHGHRSLRLRKSWGHNARPLENAERVGIRWAKSKAECSWLHPVLFESRKAAARARGFVAPPHTREMPGKLQNQAAQFAKPRYRR